MKRLMRLALAASFALTTMGLLAGNASAQTVIYVPLAPPAPVTETMPPPPGSGNTWITGYYRWDEPTQAYVWIPGHYIHTPVKGGTTWVPGHWDHGTNGYYWVAGHWSS